MNDRIAEILNQPAFDRLKDWHDIGPVQKATLELFAELIVKECILSIYRSDISDKKQERLIQELAYKFGVEE